MPAEARGGLHIVEQSLWASVPEHLRRMNAALKKHTGRELPIDATPVRFGSWMGGDRDGNPNVTAKVRRRSRPPPPPPAPPTHPSAFEISPLADAVALLALRSLPLLSTTISARHYFSLLRALCRRKHTAAFPKP